VTALALGLGSSLCWGLADFLGGFQTKRLPALVVVAFGQMGALAALVAVLALSRTGLRGDVLLPAAIAGVGLSAGLAAFYRALAAGTMGVVAPIVATGTMVPVVVGLVSGEQPQPSQATGLALAVAGVVLSVRSPPADGVTTDRNGAGLALCAAGSLGSSLVFIERAAETDVLATLAVSRGAGLVTLAVALVGTGTALRVRRSQLPALLIIGLLDVVATGLFAVASTLGLLTVVAVASSLYPAFTVLLARLALHERLSRSQAIGVASMMAGVCLMAATT
jgi:drug/metabolite transporter (DMT)-like permease